MWRIDLHESVNDGEGGIVSEEEAVHDKDSQGEEAEENAMPRLRKESHVGTDEIESIARPAVSTAHRHTSSPSTIA